MGWNRPIEDGRQTRSGTKPKRFCYFRGIIAGVIVGVAGIGVLVYLNRSPSSVPSLPDAPNPMPVKKAIPTPPAKALTKSPTNTAELAATTETKWPDKPPRGEKLWRHGEGPRSVAVTNGLLVTYPNYPGVKMILPDPANRAPFNNISDNEIASILSIQPGRTVIDAPLPPDFDRRFAESLLEKIVITDEDTPEQAEMKERVLEARKVLAEAVKRGESPREILIEERKNMRRLMQLRDNYQQIVREQVENGASAQEIHDTVKAANLMLEKEGITHPVMLPMKQAMILKQAKEAGEIVD